MMKLPRPGIRWWLFAGLLSGANAAEPVSYDRDIVPLLDRYCYTCHDDDRPKADLALVNFQTVADVRAHAATWDLVQENVRSYQMPPDDARHKPTADERELIAAWIDETLYPHDPANPDPGRSPLRRLNRNEYNHTIRDLLGLELRAADAFPADDSGYGFDNIADVQSIPPLLLEKYLAAADLILDRAIVTTPPPLKAQRFGLNQLEIGFNSLGDRGDGWVHLVSWEEDDIAVELPVPAPGDYVFRVVAFALPEGGASPHAYGGGRRKATPEMLKLNISDAPPRITLMVDDVAVQEFEVTTDAANPGTYEARVGVAPGQRRFRAVVRRDRTGERAWHVTVLRFGSEQRGIVFAKELQVEGPFPAVVRRHDAATLSVPGDAPLTAYGARLLRENGEVAVTIDAPQTGDYILRAQAYANQAGAEPVRMEFRVDGKTVQAFDVTAQGELRLMAGQRIPAPELQAPTPAVFATTVRLTAGPHRFAAAFTNDFANPAAENPNRRDRALAVQNLEIVDLSRTWEPPPMPEPLRELFARHRPTPATGLGAKLRRWFGSGPAAPSEADVARNILADFTRRAWRRPVEATEIDRLMELYALAEKNAEPFEGRVKLALKAALVSPHFVFHGAPTAGRPVAAGVQPIDEFVLASRLSYFLWSSMPDEELFELATRGQLRRHLAPQIRRLLASPKAAAFVSSFAGQWLQTRVVNDLAPDREVFPNFDQALRLGFQRETEMLFQHIMREDRSVLEFLDADYTFVNERVAQHYGIPGIEGSEFRRISLADTRRRGVLTQGGVLALTSNPNRTSPVKRGKWVLENLLGAPPPPPPANVPELDDPKRKLTGTLREQMQQHRANPVCASCHTQMDAIGFALENFDGIGAWRDREGAAAIDASGRFSSGETFEGALDLAQMLATSRRRDFVRCLSTKMLTYALGRGPEPADRHAIKQIITEVEAGGHRFSSVVLAIVNSVPFQLRRGAEPASSVASAAPARP